MFVGLVFPKRSPPFAVEFLKSPLSDPESFTTGAACGPAERYSPSPRSAAADAAKVSRLRRECCSLRRLGAMARLDGIGASGQRDESLTYSALDRDARTVGAALSARVERGDRALLMYPPGLDYVVAFFGCLFAGVVPVPVKFGDVVTLDFAVRGDRLNVWVNGKLTSVYRLPVARKPGTFTIWTHDATAEFLEVRLAELPDSVVLADKREEQRPSPVGGPIVLTKADAEKTLADHTLIGELTQLNIRFGLYYAPGGRLVGVLKGAMSGRDRGAWRVADDGKVCMRWSGLPFQKVMFAAPTPLGAEQPGFLQCGEMFGQRLA